MTLNHCTHQFFNQQKFPAFHPSTFKFQCNVNFDFCIATHIQVTQKPVNLQFFQVRGESDTDIQNCIHDTYPKFIICAKFICQTHIFIHIHAVIQVHLV